MKHNFSDAVVLDGVRKTKDGYLAAFANVARTGVQKYKGRELGRPDLDDVMVYRPPEEVFHRDALHSMAHRPVTLNHPSEVVDSKNWKKYAMGHTGDEVVRDGDHVRVPMVLMDAAAIAAVEKGGTRELSMGYSTDLKWTPGVTDAGEKYDAVQTEIRANHLAIVPVARGGDKLRFGDAATRCRDCDALIKDNAAICDNCGAKVTKDAVALPDGSFSIKDAGDLRNAIDSVSRAKNYKAARRHIISRARALGAVSELPEDWKPTTDAADGGLTKGRTKMSTIIMIDGAPVEVADELSAAVISNKIKALDAFAKKAKEDEEEATEAAAAAKKEMGDALTTTKAALDAATGEIAVLKKQVADASITPDKLDALVLERTLVIDAAASLLPKDFAYNGKQIGDIRRAAVAAKLGDVKDMNDAAIEGAFKALTIGNAPQGGARALADHLSRGGGANNGVALRDEAFNDYVTRQQNAWKTPRA